MEQNNQTKHPHLPEERSRQRCCRIPGGLMIFLNDGLLKMTLSILYYKSFTSCLWVFSQIGRNMFVYHEVLSYKYIIMVQCKTVSCTKWPVGEITHTTVQWQNTLGTGVQNKTFFSYAGYKKYTMICLTLFPNNFRGHYMTPIQTSCIIIGKFLKITSNICCTACWIHLNLHLLLLWSPPKMGSKIYLPPSTSFSEKAPFPLEFSGGIFGPGGSVTSGWRWSWWQCLCENLDLQRPGRFWPNYYNSRVVRSNFVNSKLK